MRFQLAPNSSTMVVVCVGKKIMLSFLFYSFLAVSFVAKHCILQRKFLNWQIGTCLLGTRWYNF